MRVLIFSVIFLVSACTSTKVYNVDLDKHASAKLERSEDDATVGRVRMSFDISATGTPENIKILGSSPSGVFDSDAIEALSGWRYKPKIVNGISVKQTNMEVILDFKLEKRGS